MLLTLTRRLDDRQGVYLEAEGGDTAQDDDSSPEAIVMVMHSLADNPAASMELRRALNPEALVAFQQLAILAKRPLEQRAEPEAPMDSVETASTAAPEGQGSWHGPALWCLQGGWDRERGRDLVLANRT